MTTDRCPACGAAVTASAAWCTLCYADLRPRQPEPVAVAAAPVSAPVSAPAALPPDAILDAPVMAAPAIARRELTTWPCGHCGTQVPMADDVCGNCGASFLPSDPGVKVVLPVVGNVAALDKAQRVGLMLAGVAAVIVVFLAVGFLFGAIF